jgi:hypothetical protein
VTKTKRIQRTGFDGRLQKYKTQEDFNKTNNITRKRGQQRKTLDFDTEKHEKPRSLNFHRYYSSYVINVFHSIYFAWCSLFY